MKKRIKGLQRIKKRRSKTKMVNKSLRGHRNKKIISQSPQAKTKIKRSVNSTKSHHCSPGRNTESSYCLWP